MSLLGDTLAVLPPALMLEADPEEGPSPAPVPPPPSSTSTIFSSHPEVTKGLGVCAGVCVGSCNERMSV